MSHEIDMSNGRANFAYVNEAAWHGLGHQLSPDSPIPVWITEAGFDWEIKSAPVQASTPADGVINMPDKHLLYRGDTLSPLSVVSSRYKIVQPPEVLRFYEDLVEAGGFQLETAGMLFGGKRFFALAKVDEGSDVVKGDRVKGYLLLSTSCDGSLATSAQFTSIRVVCNNTLRMAIRDHNGDEQSRISIPHSATFDPAKVKSQLGLANDSFLSFMEDMRLLADRKLNNREAITYLIDLVGDPTRSLEDQSSGDANQMKLIYDLYTKDGMGHELAGLTAWGMLNAVTEMVDHHTGHKTTDARMDSAWFGTGAALKQRAYDQAMLLAA
jgi:phage/plasmid-like protein (TIGR03299 family)